MSTTTHAVAEAWERRCKADEAHDIAERAWLNDNNDTTWAAQQTAWDAYCAAHIAWSDAQWAADKETTT